MPRRYVDASAIANEGMVKTVPIWECPDCGQTIAFEPLPDVCDGCADKGSRELTNWKRL